MVKLQDRATRQLNAISGKFRSVGRGVADLARKFTMLAGVAGIAAVGLAARNAISTFTDFEKAIANAASVTGATGEVFEATKTHIEAVSRELGETTVFSASQAANAFYDLASAGYNVADMTKSELKPILDLAAATQTDLTKTTEVVTSTLGQFGLGMESSGRIADVFAATIGSSKATIEALEYSLKYVGPVAKSMGMEIEEVNAILGTLYNAGFKGEQAGTALRGAFSRLLNPTTAVIDQLSAMGLELEDVDPTTRDFADILDTLADAGLDTAGAMALFGVEAAPAMLALTENTDGIRELESALSDAGGTAETMATQQLDTLSGSFALLKSALEGVSITLGKALAPYVRAFVDGMTAAIPKVMDFASSLKSKLDPAIMAAYHIIDNLKIIFAAFIGELWTAEEATTSIAGVINVVMEVFAMFTDHVVRAIPSIKSFGESVKNFMVGAYNTLLSIISVVTPVFKSFIDFIIASIPAIKSFGTSVKNFMIGAYNTLSAIIDYVSPIFGSFINYVISSIPAIKNFGAAVISYAVAAFNLLSSVVSAAIPVVESIASAVSSVLSSAFEFLAPKISYVIQLIKENLSPAFQYLKAILSSVASVISAFAEGMASRLTPALESVRNTISNLRTIFSNLFNDVTKTTGSIDLFQEAMDVLAILINAKIAMFEKITAFFASHPEATKYAIAIGAAVLAIMNPLLALKVLSAAFTVAWVKNWGGIRDVVGGVIDKIKNVLDGAKEKIGIIKASLSTAFEGIKESLRGAFEKGSVSVLIFIENVLPKLIAGVSEILPKIITFALGIKDKLGMAFTFVSEKVNEFIPRIIELANYIKDRLQPSTDAVQTIFKSIGPIIGHVVEGFKEGTQALKDNQIGFADLMPIVDGAIFIFNTLWTVIAAVFKFFADHPTITKFAAAIAVAIAIITSPILAVVAAMVILSVAWSKDWLGIKTTTLKITAAIKKGIEKFLKAVKKFWDKHGDKIVKAAQFIWDTIKTAFEIWVAGFQAVINVAMALIKGDWKGAWDAITEYVDTVAEAITKLWDKWGDDIKKFFKDVWKDLKTKVSDWVKDVVNLITTWASDVLGVITGWVTDTIAAFVGWVKDLIGASILTDFKKDSIQLFKDWAKDVLGKITGWVTDSISAFTDWASDTLSDLGDWIGDFISDFADWSSDVLGNLGDWASDFISDFADWSSDVLGDLGGWISDFASDFLDWSNDNISDLSDWTSDFLSDFGTWSSDVLSDLGTWASDYGSDFAEWASGNIADLGNWASNYITDFGAWSSDVLGDLRDWASDYATDFGEWASGNISDLGAWISDFISDFGDWSSDVLGDLGTWVIDSKTKFTDWIDDVIGESGIITGWISTFIADFGTWSSDVLGVIDTWATDAKTKYETWVDGIIGEDGVLTGWFNDVVDLFDGLMNIEFSWPEIPNPFEGIDFCEYIPTWFAKWMGICGESPCGACETSNEGCTSCEISSEECTNGEGCTTGCEVSCETSGETGCTTGCEVNCETSGETCSGPSEECGTSEEMCSVGCETEQCQLGCQTCESSCETSCQSSCETSCQTNCEAQPTCEWTCQTVANCPCMLCSGEGCETSCEKGVPGPSSYATGGTVRETGMALVHKGEFVVPTHAATAFKNPASTYTIAPTINVTVSGDISDQASVQKLAREVSRIVTAELKKMVT